MWSIDNFGDKAICLIVDGEVFEWDSAATDATNSRATIISGAPTASRHMLSIYTGQTLSVLWNRNNDW